MPVYLIWNEKRYPIDKVLQIRKAASVVGDCVILYKLTSLFLYEVCATCVMF